MALQQESEAVTASPKLKQRVDARLGRRSTFRVRALSLAAIALVIAVALITYFTAGPKKDEGLVSPPTGDTTYFAGYWPAHALAEARDLTGGQWRDPEQVVRAYAETLGWHEPELSNEVVKGDEATVELTPGLGANHVVALVQAGENWVVSAIADDNISVSEPTSGATTERHTSLKGSARVFEGQVNVTALDDDGHELGHTSVMGGGSEMTPFDGTIDLTKPSTTAGIIKFEGSNGSGGPSTDVTIVRVRFDGSSWDEAQATAEPTAAPTPHAKETVIKDYGAFGNPDDAFHCFFEAMHQRDFQAGKNCMTDRYKATFTDPVQFTGPSSPSLVRATILSSQHTDSKETYALRTYWGSSQGLEFTAEDQLTVTNDPNRAWLVDDWHEDQQRPVQGTMRTQVTFLRPEADQVDCGANGPADSSFVNVTREVLDEPSTNVTQARVMTVAQETLTGPWSWDGAQTAVPAFPRGERVDSVDINGNDVHFVMHGTDYRPSAGCDYARIALQRAVSAIDGLGAAQVTISTGGGGP